MRASLAQLIDRVNRMLADGYSQTEAYTHVFLTLQWHRPDHSALLATGPKTKRRHDHDQRERTTT